MWNHKCALLECHLLFVFESLPSPFVAQGEKGPCYMVPWSSRMKQGFVLSSCFSSVILVFDGKEFLLALPFSRRVVMIAHAILLSHVLSCYLSFESRGGHGVVDPYLVDMYFLNGQSICPSCQNLCT